VLNKSRIVRQGNRGESHRIGEVWNMIPRLLRARRNCTYKMGVIQIERSTVGNALVLGSPAHLHLQAYHSRIFESFSQDHSTVHRFCFALE
jgi:hypothetical protein